MDNIEKIKSKKEYEKQINKNTNVIINTFGSPTSKQKPTVNLQVLDLEIDKTENDDVERITIKPLVGDENLSSGNYFDKEIVLNDENYLGCIKELLDKSMIIDLKDGESYDEVKNNYMLKNDLIQKSINQINYLRYDYDKNSNKILLNWNNIDDLVVPSSSTINNINFTIEDENGIKYSDFKYMTKIYWGKINKHNISFDIFNKDSLKIFLSFFYLYKAIDIDKTLYLKTYINNEFLFNIEIIFNKYISIYKNKGDINRLDDNTFSDYKFDYKDGRYCINMEYPGLSEDKKMHKLFLLEDDYCDGNYKDKYLKNIEKLKKVGKDFTVDRDTVSSHYFKSFGVPSGKSSDNFDQYNLDLMGKVDISMNFDKSDTKIKLTDYAKNKIFKINSRYTENDKTIRVNQIIRISKYKCIFVLAKEDFNVEYKLLNSNIKNINIVKEHPSIANIFGDKKKDLLFYELPLYDVFPFLKWQEDFNLDNYLDKVNLKGDYDFHENFKHKLPTLGLSIPQIVSLTGTLSGNSCDLDIAALNLEGYYNPFSNDFLNKCFSVSNNDEVISRYSLKNNSIGRWFVERRIDNTYKYFNDSSFRGKLDMLKKSTQRRNDKYSYVEDSRYTKATSNSLYDSSFSLYFFDKYRICFEYKGIKFDFFQTLETPDISSFSDFNKYNHFYTSNFKNLTNLTPNKTELINSHYNTDNTGSNPDHFTKRAQSLGYTYGETYYIYKMLYCRNYQTIFNNKKINTSTNINYLNSLVDGINNDYGVNYLDRLVKYLYTMNKSLKANENILVQEFPSFVPFYDPGTSGDKPSVNLLFNYLDLYNTKSIDTTIEKLDNEQSGGKQIRLSKYPAKDGVTEPDTHIYYFCQKTTNDPKDKRYMYGMPPNTQNQRDQQFEPISHNTLDNNNIFPRTIQMRILLNENSGSLPNDMKKLTKNNIESYV